MTEMIEAREPLIQRHLIDPVMFFAALILAPLFVTALTFWILLIPVMALFMGLPVYLLTATPVLLWWLTRHEPNVIETAALGFTTNLCVCGVIYGYALIEMPHDPMTMPMLYLIFGSIFAPVWAGMFAWLYGKMRRPFFAQTV